MNPMMTDQHCTTSWSTTTYGERHRPLPCGYLRSSLHGHLPPAASSTARSRNFTTYYVLSTGLLHPPAAPHIPACPSRRTAMLCPLSPPLDFPKHSTNLSAKCSLIRKRSQCDSCTSRAHSRTAHSNSPASPRRSPGQAEPPLHPHPGPLTPSVNSSTEPENSFWVKHGRTAVSESSIDKHPRAHLDNNNLSLIAMVSHL
jgi:hypothetical protein